MTTRSFVLIVTDQQRERAWWPKSVQLPALESLCARGLSFRRAYTPSALCTPARAALFTGQHAAAVGMDDNVNFRWQGSLSTAVPTLATRLGALGYHVAYLGKWHLTTKHALWARGLGPYGFRGWRGPDTHGVPHGGLRDDPRIAADAVSWLQTHARAARPFCLVVSFVNPHDIMFSPRVRRPTREAHGAPAPASLRESLGDKPSIHRRFRRVGNLVGGFVGWPAPPWQEVFDAYVDYQLAVDANVQRVLAALEDTGLGARTTTIYTSDHGELAGAHGLRGKGPVMYEENCRVPLVWSAPGRIPEGAATDALWSSIDLLPTLLAQAGAPADAATELPGVDQSAVLSEPGARARDAILVSYRARSTMGIPWSRARGWLVGRFDGRHKIARYHAPNAAPFGPGAEPRGFEHEVYDVQSDPGERHNLAPGMSEAELAAMMRPVEALALAERAWPPGQVAAAVK